MNGPHNFNPVKRNKRILSVDDEPGILCTRQILLEMEGYDVLSAADGEKALQLFAGRAVDLVVLDYAMPGMDGGSVAREIKNQRPQVHVIIVSASEVPEETLSTCVDAFIRKGEGPTVLLDRIKQALAPVLKCSSDTDGEDTRCPI